jgi:integrase
MTKKSLCPPKMGNNGGTAFVRINGKRIYLGKFGTPQANQNYARRIAEWAVSNPAKPTLPVGHMTVATLAIAFLDQAQKNDHAHFHAYRTATELLLQLYAGTMVGDFTPKCLVAVQHQLTQLIGKKGKRHSRQYCNTLVNHIRRMFRWGVAQELVSPITAEALKYVPPLQQGRTDAPETKPREDVADEAVHATLSYLLPTVATMAQVQRLALMRPNEVCRMRVGDIDRSREDGIWIYAPPKHKGTWRGHQRIIPLGELEQALILPYLENKTPDQAVFSPKTAMLEKKAKDAAHRKTKVFPGQVERAARHAANPKLRVGEHYTPQSYANAIKRAVEMANRSLPDDQKIPHWTPYQLRHAGVTELVYENDGNLDVARAVAGQKSIVVTQRYNHADVQVAIRQAKQRKNKAKTLSQNTNVAHSETGDTISKMMRFTTYEKDQGFADRTNHDHDESPVTLLMYLVMADTMGNERRIYLNRIARESDILNIDPGTKWGYLCASVPLGT